MVMFTVTAFLLFGQALAYNTTVVNINQIVDLKLQLANRMAVLTNSTTVEYGSGFIPGIASYEGAVGIGLDSLVRTGNCQMIFEGNSITYHYNIGQALLATFFRRLTVGDNSGSGYYRAFNNSLEYSYTVSYGGALCSTRLNHLSLTMSNIEVYMLAFSWRSAENSKFQDTLRDTILPGLNRKLEEKYGRIEENLESIFCRSRGRQTSSTQGLDVLRSFLF